MFSGKALQYIVLIFVFFGLFLFSPERTQADPINFIALRTDLFVRGEIIDFRTDVPYVLTFPIEGREARLTFATGYFDANFIIESNGSSCRVAVERITTDARATAFEGRFVCSKRVQKLEDLKIQSRLFLDLFAEVNHFLKIHISGEESEVLLTKQNQTFFGSSFKEGIVRAMGDRSPVGLFSILKQFAGLGIPHILFGFDHILFILAIHTIVRKFKDICIIVTSFTVAHSLTLILAGLGLVTVTSRIVEPLIAFSIAYTAARNIVLLRQGTSEKKLLQERWVSTFGFGLVHGLGFAGALTDIKIPAAYFIPALLSFNAGVEIGQFIIIAVFVSFLLFMKRLGWLTRVLYGLSGAIVLVSSVWVIQRIFF